jgi:hypothetical protein
MSDMRELITSLIAEGHSKPELASLIADRCALNGHDTQAAHALLEGLWQEKLSALPAQLRELIDGGVTLKKTNTNPPDYEFTWWGHPGTVTVPLSRVFSRKSVHLAMWGRWDASPLLKISQKAWPDLVEQWPRSGFSGVVDAGGADFAGQILRGLEAYFQQRGKAETLSDAQAGGYVRKVDAGIDVYAFLVRPGLLGYLKKWTGKEVTPSNLRIALNDYGLRTSSDARAVRFPGGVQDHTFWVIPARVIDGRGDIEPGQRELDLGGEGAGDGELPDL